MNNTERQRITPQDDPEQKSSMSFGKKLRRRALMGAAGLTVATAFGGPTAVRAAESVKDHFDGPEMHGSKIVRIAPGDTLSEIANEEVEGGASHTGAVVDAIQNDPDNKVIFENGTGLGSEDLGKELDIPRSVED